MHNYDHELYALTLGQAGDGPGPSSGVVCPEGQVFVAEMNACINPGALPTSGGDIVECAPGEAVDFSTGECVSGGLPAGFVAPGAVAVRPGNWDVDHKPMALYTLASGDTYTGLAKTYLGNGARWPELWEPNRSQHPNPDQIFVGQRINMIDEARDNFKKKAGGKDGAGYPQWMWIAAGVAAAGGIYLAVR